MSSAEKQAKEPTAASMPSIRRELAAPYELVLRLLPKALETEGFGVLTEIDVKQTLEKKLGIEFRRYAILGSCNPSLARQALESNLEVGVLLPCNVVVYEAEDGGSIVSAVDPEKAIGPFGGPELSAIAGEVRERLTRVLDKLGLDVSGGSS